MSDSMKLGEKLNVGITRADDKYDKPIVCPNCNKERFYIITCEHCGHRRD